MNPLDYALSKHPIIVSLMDLKDLDRALSSLSQIVILMHADICSLEETANRIKEKDKLVFVHIDLMKGIQRDASGIQYLAEKMKIDGIVTTHSNLIPIARRLDLLTIQRVFILDSESIEKGFKSIKESKPDAVEILPGITVPYIQHKLKEHIKQTIIAGGLINSEDETIYILRNGAKGISGSKKALWDISGEIKEKIS